MNFLFLREVVIVKKDGLKEDQVGISEYINKGEGFNGIIKSRFSDFHVNEIDIDGKILHLTDLSIPEEKEGGISRNLCIIFHNIKTIVNFNYPKS